MVWVGTLAVLVVAAVCVRLGFWQLGRLSQKHELNSAVQSRSHMSPIALRGAESDTTGLILRQVTVSGQYDNARTIVLAGRSHGGIPGVHIFVPLRIAGSDRVVYVNRGWAPSPDAASIDLAPFEVDGPVTVRGLVVAFPELGDEASRAAGGEGWRTTWYTLDGRGIAAQYPGQLLNFYVQELRDDGSQELPIALPIPELDEGMHLSYAIQWFSFATIFIVGWIAVLVRGRARADAVPAPAPSPARAAPR